ncbi:MAG TPA: hypothetical protein PLJ33_07160 [Peptococcaceae bacterium]|jgi:hypothetical protein|nr:hypothetical protein [Peptococcaceae bacterium]HPZ71396.1 hypothetical protein [Peptococcaceae bacterium]HQD54613.1 hypothetical protein [Peptococcaceae bacterium]
MKKRIVLTALLVFVLQCLPLTAFAAAKYDPYGVVNWNNVANYTYNAAQKVYGAAKWYFTPSNPPQNSAFNRTVNYTKNVVNNAVQVIW